MNWIKSFFGIVLRFFTSGAAQKAFERAAELVPQALPVITIAAQIVVGITPNQVDDAVLAMIKTKYPQLFDGSLNDADHVKLFTLGVATDLLKAKFPDVSTSIARLAIQTAYTGASADKAA